jgi:hypothetical protein
MKRERNGNQNHGARDRYACWPGISLPAQTFRPLDILSILRGNPILSRSVPTTPLLHSFHCGLLWTWLLRHIPVFFNTPTPLNPNFSGYQHFSIVPVICISIVVGSCHIYRPLTFHTPRTSPFVIILVATSLVSFLLVSILVGFRLGLLTLDCPPFPGLIGWSNG